MAAAVVLAVALGRWAWNGQPTRLEHVALGLGIAALVTGWAFWSGWPLVFGLTAAGLALEYRRRVGSLSARSTIGLVLGLLAFTAGAFLCVVG
ncbi:hypothetical protein N802_10610 [Knoellia sinensis KCTC 19936]|uniref:Uncharacterized protein n=1 Tax=Knoellia sinensis KCTC 19936 TaxID=1385520 RepID=A0A0A0J4N4_9MICO|nr:hypothetical protein [Knoellia sinensis]KGN32168.1 hypothetical protein N802_10610 [Knoellia sinensis KCTC 19936]